MELLDYGNFYTGLGTSNYFGVLESFNMIQTIETKQFKQYFLLNPIKAWPIDQQQNVEQDHG